MIDPDKRQAIYTLHKQGVGIREIARLTRVAVNTVIAIIRKQGVMPDTVRKDKIVADTDLLRKLYQKCDGRVQRVHELLTEEHGKQIGYSTLTRMLRELELGHKKERCDQAPDEPGAEMQHDTSEYTPKLGDRRIKVVGSLLYFRYSKVRYLKFYRSFNRFKMKCFFHEALMFWEYCAKTCIIDNTNLARLHGTGKNAVIVPEMEHFAGQYGFEFICHELGHSNRKAGNERGFFTVETNFFPGRTFGSFEDMNQQAFSWATERLPNRPTGKTRLIPGKAFEFEKAYLVKISGGITPPYLVHERLTDQYGYVSFAGNFYWIPGTSRYPVKVLEYGDRLKIYHQRELLGEYDLPVSGARNEKISPKGQKKPTHQPHNRKKPTSDQEKKLRAVSPEVNAYLDFIFQFKGKKRHQLIRRLYGLFQKLSAPLFIKSVERALVYRITDITVIERIAVLKMQSGGYQIPSADIDNEYHHRQTFLDGQFTDDVDFSSYDHLEDDHG